jgi:NAD(P)-dependent dehydrogenase (short-subunit alcohol dehydrogenase family)
VATCRDPDRAAALAELQALHPGRLQITQLNSADEDSIAAAAAAVAASHPKVDLLLNVSGILHLPGVLSPETALSRVTMENLELTFRTNTFGPILVAKAFSPLLIAAGKGATDDSPAVIASLSARVGSISDNRLGGWYSYRASKSALNQLTKTMSLELARKNQHVAAIVLHPGTVDTDLSTPFQRNVVPEKLFTRERAVGQLLGIVDRVSMADTGKFYAWDGAEIPW